jgi:hypothetical protein
MRSRDAFRAGACVVLVIAAPALSGATANTSNFFDRVVAAHNRERDAAGAPPLVWDEKLAAGARSWATHLAKTGEFAHSPDEPGAEPIGENIWGGTATRYSPEAMVSLWVAEKRFFKPGTFPDNSTTGDVRDVGHYTQLVWRSSRAVGCGVSRGEREDILVCRYAAAGNMIGERPL